MKKTKLQGIKLLKVYLDFNLEYRTYNGWHCIGTAIYKQGLIVRKVKFIYNEQTEFKVAYFEDNDTSYRIPSDRLQNEALLVLIYGEIGKFKAMQEKIQYFKNKRAKEKQRLEEEERKRIKLGEQISIEKYLLNIK